MPTCSDVFDHIRTHPWAIVTWLVTVLTLVFSIVMFLQPFWDDFTTPFAVKFGELNNVRPNCEYKLTFLSVDLTFTITRPDCTSYNVVRALLLIAFFANVISIFLIKIIIVLPLYRTHIRMNPNWCYLPMILAWMCNTAVIVVYGVWTRSTNGIFTTQIGFGFFVFVLVCQTILVITSHLMILFMKRSTLPQHGYINLGGGNLRQARVQNGVIRV